MTYGPLLVSVPLQIIRKRTINFQNSPVILVTTRLRLPAPPSPALRRRRAVRLGRMPHVQRHLLRSAARSAAADLHTVLLRLRATRCPVHRSGGAAHHLHRGIVVAVLCAVAGRRMRLAMLLALLLMHVMMTVRLHGVDQQTSRRWHRHKGRRGGWHHGDGSYWRARLQLLLFLGGQHGGYGLVATANLAGCRRLADQALVDFAPHSLHVDGWFGERLSAD